MVFERLILLIRFIDLVGLITTFFLSRCCSSIGNSQSWWLTLVVCFRVADYGVEKDGACCEVNEGFDKRVTFHHQGGCQGARVQILLFCFGIDSTVVCQ